jgi:hypothetical protein
VLYRSASIFSVAAAFSLLAGIVLMFSPLIAYVHTHTVAEWMIYRFLVSSLAGQVAELLLGAGIITARITSIALQDEARNKRTLWIRTRWLWILVTTLVAASGVLVWPSAVQLWRTGHTDVHWSRFVVAMGFSFSAEMLVVIWAIDSALDFVETRVNYLWNDRNSKHS